MSPGIEASWSRRRFLGLAAAIGGGAALGGCAAGSESVAGELPELPADVAEFLRRQGKTLGVDRVSVLAYASPQAEAVKAFTAQFAELTGIEVDWTGLDEQSAASRASVALGSGAGGYDILQTSSGLLPTYIGRGWVADLSALRGSSAAAIPTWDPAVYGPGTVAMLSEGDALYAVPNFIGTNIFLLPHGCVRAGRAHRAPDPGRPARGLRRGAQRGAVRDRAAQRTERLAVAVRLERLALCLRRPLLRRLPGRPLFRGGDRQRRGAAGARVVRRAGACYAPSGATNWSVEDVTRSFTTGRVAIVQEGAVFGGTFNDPDASQAAGKVGTSSSRRARPVASCRTTRTAGSWPSGRRSGTRPGCSPSGPPCRRSSPPRRWAGWPTRPRRCRRSTGRRSIGTIRVRRLRADGAGDDQDRRRRRLHAVRRRQLPAAAGRLEHGGQKISEELSKAVTGQVDPRLALAAAARAMQS